MNFGPYLGLNYKFFVLLLIKHFRENSESNFFYAMRLCDKHFFHNKNAGKIASKFFVFYPKAQYPRISIKKKFLCSWQ